jgi:hypothetical protein
MTFKALAGTMPSISQVGQAVPDVWSHLPGGDSRLGSVFAIVEPPPYVVPITARHRLAYAIGHVRSVGVGNCSERRIIRIDEYKT